VPCGAGYQVGFNLGLAEPPGVIRRIMVSMGHADIEITPFLKSRRAALDPAEVGLPDGFARRRVRGLRREEVAGLAGISVDYYTRIEQGRAAAVSDGVLDGIARALRLTPPEHAYLRNITIPRRRTDSGATCQVRAGTTRPRPGVRPQILELLEALEDTVPAVVYGAGLDLLAWNRLGGRLGFDFDALPDSELNAARLMFLHPEARTVYPDWTIARPILPLPCAPPLAAIRPAAAAAGHLRAARAQRGVPGVLGRAGCPGHQPRGQTHPQPRGGRAGTDL